MTDNTNSNSSANPFDGTEIRIVGAFDPALINFLPPELRQKILKEVQAGSGGLDSQQETPKEKPTPKTKIKYDYKMVNCNQDLKELTTKLKKSKVKQYGMLLYGESGCGKSYYAEWLAQELGMPIIKKRASDLQNKFVGETEKLIAAAFKEAREAKAVLLFDEADSFLYSRKFGQQDFQISHVNEMLTQMESHEYPFIMTTNLKTKIDSAAMRRFIFKIRFDYMTEQNITNGIKTYFGKEYKLSKEQLKQLTNITAGDFKVAKQKIDILDNGEYTNDRIFEYLLKEQEEKDIIKASTVINF